MAKPAKTKPVTAAELLNGPDGVGTAASGAAPAATDTTDAAALGNAPGTAAATEPDTSISGTVDPLVDKVDTGTAVADMTAATATPSTGATSQDIAPGAAMLLTVPAAPTSGETNSLASPETPQLGAAAGDIFSARGRLITSQIADLTGPQSVLAEALRNIGADVPMFVETTPVLDAAEPADEEESRWFTVTSPILRDGSHHDIGDPIKVTKGEHKSFRASGSIEEDWDE